MQTLILAMLVIAAFSRAQAGEIADAYFKNVQADINGWMKSRTNMLSSTSATITNHGVTLVGIEHTVCFGTCPAYTFIVKNDGTFRYKGEKYAERQGDFTGTVPACEFHRLAQFIKDSGYMQLSNTYERGITDQSSVLTMVVMNGRQKIISDYAAAGPPRLWAVEQLIDGLLAHANWNKAQ
jgi:hypothetical protein